MYKISISGKSIMTPGPRIRADSLLVILLGLTGTPSSFQSSVDSKTFYYLPRQNEST